MKIIYAGEKLNKSKFSIFLAGPTPREKSINSWRPDFINILKQKGFKGSVFVPENRILGSPYDFEKQINWEVEGLTKANLIIFWIPRKIDTMPAFTTNIEFGEFMHSGKIAVGFPVNSEKNKYITKRCEMHNIPLFSTIDELIAHACKKEWNHLNECNKCFGTGHKDSNGMSYRCFSCDGKGYLKQLKQ